MKFWHKTFLCVLLIFLIAFDIGSYLLVRKGYDINSELTIKSGLNDYFSASQMIEMSLENFFKNTKGTPLPLFRSIAEVYKNQGVYMEIYDNEAVVFSNFLKFNDSRDELKRGYVSSVYRMINGDLYLFTVGKLKDGRYTLVLIRDSNFLIEYSNEIRQYLILISITISVILSSLLILILLKLLRPLHKLNRVTNEIADGNYSMRGEINSKDEIGEFSRKFNRMAEAVALHVEELKQSNEQKERFTNSLTHELKTPLATIKGYSELLCKANLSEEEKRMAYTYIYEHSLRLQSLTQKLMELLYLKKDTLIQDKVSVEKLFDEVIKLSYDNLKNKDIQLEMSVEESSIQGDEMLLQTLLINLLENAIKASDHDGKIILRSYQPATIEVTDFGVGIPENEVHKITEEFYRVDKSRSRELGGLGLGLSICKQIVDLHGGTIEIISSIGEFTTVKVVFATA